FQSLVEQRSRRRADVHDVALARDGDHRSGEAEDQPAGSADDQSCGKSGAAAVVDDDHLAAVRAAADAAQEPAVRTGDIDDVIARARDVGEVLVAANLDPRRAPYAEARRLVVADDRGVALAHDQPAGLFDDDAATGFPTLLALRVQLIDVAGDDDGGRHGRSYSDRCCGL